MSVTIATVVLGVALCALGGAVVAVLAHLAKRQDEALEARSRGRADDGER